ncbi:ATP-binding cassette domain-containing protein [uncultured Shewanella sp.]|uniref:ATP-binding cassette domain-containing protein n=1 Tax=uncultured Shewanella sp. TaxID=173975 RepID=UPI00262D5A1C|nr:ATP-binding cassette domain-containing protein [uncultured Shewanella sp.]
MGIKSRYSNIYFWFSLSVLSNVLNIGLIILITKAITLVEYYGVFLFLCLFSFFLLLYFTTNYFSSEKVNEYFSGLAALLRIELQRSVTNMKYEEMFSGDSGSAKVLLTRDVGNVESALKDFLEIANSIFISFSLIIYMSLFYTEQVIVLIIGISIILPIIFVIINNSKVRHNETREAFKKVSEDIDDSINGFRELKQDVKKKKLFLDCVSNSNIYHLHRKQQFSWLYENKLSNIFNVSVYILIVVVMIDFEKGHNNDWVFIMLMFMVISPISIVIVKLPRIIEARMSYLNIKEFIDNHESDDNIDSNVESHIILDKGVDKLTFKDICYQYSDNRGFCFGPLSITLNKGTINFITGGNGEGKSTLINLMSLLLKPTSGVVALNDVEIKYDDFCLLQQNVSVVFQNPYIFDSFFYLDMNSVGNDFNNLIDIFGLKGKVYIKNGEVHGVNTLSFGERKRLSLICALLEDNDVYILDEWAADQDPYFRCVFYTEILPSLKNEGKILIVVSHDDDYFYLADYIYKIRQGKIISGDT